MFVPQVPSFPRSVLRRNKHDRITNSLYSEIAEDAKETVVGHLTNIQMLNVNSLQKVMAYLDRPDSLCSVVKEIVSRNPVMSVSWPRHRRL